MQPVEAMKKKRVKKAPHRMVGDCETNLRFLLEACELYLGGDEDRYKQVAAELRVLVCKTPSNKPLLLDLMEVYGFAYEVPLPQGGPPVIEPSHDLVVNPERPGIDNIETVYRPVPLREFVNRGLAVYMRPWCYTNQALTVAVAQQLGSSHEDESIEEPIAQMHYIHVGGDLSYERVLIGFASVIVKAGLAFLQFMQEEHGYQATLIAPLD